MEAKSDQIKGVIMPQKFEGKDTQNCLLYQGRDEIEGKRGRADQKGKETPKERGRNNEMGELGNCFSQGGKPPSCKRKFRKKRGQKGKKKKIEGKNKGLEDWRVKSHHLRYFLSTFNESRIQRAIEGGLFREKNSKKSDIKGQEGRQYTNDEGGEREERSI